MEKNYQINNPILHLQKLEEGKLNLKIVKYDRTSTIVDLHEMVSIRMME